MQGAVVIRRIVVVETFCRHLVGKPAVDGLVTVRRLDLDQPEAQEDREAEDGDFRPRVRGQPGDRACEAILRPGPGPPGRMGVAFALGRMGAGGAQSGRNQPQSGGVSNGFLRSVGHSTPFEWKHPGIRDDFRILWAGSYRLDSSLTSLTMSVALALTLSVPPAGRYDLAEAV